MESNKAAAAVTRTCARKLILSAYDLGGGAKHPQAVINSWTRYCGRYRAPASVLALIREIAGAVHHQGCAERTNYLALWITRNHGSERNQIKRPTFFLPLREVAALTGLEKNEVEGCLKKLDGKYIERVPVPKGASLYQPAWDGEIIRKPILWRFTFRALTSMRRVQRWFQWKYPRPELKSDICELLKTSFFLRKRGLSRIALF